MGGVGGPLRAVQSHVASPHVQCHWVYPWRWNITLYCSQGGGNIPPLCVQYGATFHPHPHPQLHPLRAVKSNTSLRAIKSDISHPCVNTHTHTHTHTLSPTPCVIYRTVFHLLVLYTIVSTDTFRTIVLLHLVYNTER